MSMLNQLFTARLIPSDKYYRKPSTPVCPTCVAAALEIDVPVPVVQVQQQDEENATVYDVESVSDDATVYDQEDVTHCSDAESDVTLQSDWLMS